MRLLIDSSIWIDFLKNGDNEHLEVATAVRGNYAYLCQPVWVELWSGARGKREEIVLKHMHECCGWLEIDDKTWQLAAELRRKARRTGLNCPLSDVLIAACAKRHGANLLHRDKHLETLMKLS